LPTDPGAGRAGPELYTLNRSRATREIYAGLRATV
jgi:hypothetical protein